MRLGLFGGRGTAVRSKLQAYRSPGLLVALVLLVVVAVCSFVGWQRYVRFANTTRHTNEALAILHEMVRGLREAESSQRGYFLTHDQQYLTEYFGAVSHVRGSLSALHALPAEIREDGLESSLASAVRFKLGELALTIDVAAQDGIPDAIQIVRSNRELHHMINVEALAADYVTALRNKLVTNRENSRFYARLAQYVSTFGCAGIFFLVFLANRRITRLLTSATSLNEELTRANTDLQQFAFSASHDLQEPLRTVALYSQLAVKRAEESRPFHLELGYVTKAAKLMSQMIHDLLVYTEALTEMPAERAEADMNRVVKSTCEAFRGTLEELKAEVIYGNLPTLPISDLHARIVAQNMISNAMKYHSALPPKLEITARRDGTDWILAFQDNGIGIDPAYHERIFGLFKRLHARDEYPGTGLGLAICRKIIERYGGRIWIESNLGGGSKFLIRLPA